jgi:hypothetical protein
MILRIQITSTNYNIAHKSSLAMEQLSDTDNGDRVLAADVPVYNL